MDFSNDLQKHCHKQNSILSSCKIRVLLVLTVKYNLEMVQSDVKTAFLHGELNDRIYMSVPNGIKIASSSN